jgi:DNA-binding NtrC family response regulator
LEKYNVLLVDDQDDNLSSTKELLRRWGYCVDAVSSADEAIECVRRGAKDYAVAVLDYRMPEKTGAEAAKEIRALNDEMVLIIYSAYPTVESITESIRARVINYIDKNEDLNLLKNALTAACSEYEKVRKAKPPIPTDEATRLIASIGMVGRSEKMARIAQQVHKFRGSKKPILILGETGVGKEMIAKALHGGTKDNFFVVNCATLGSLAESELFGHEKGSFTGAINRKVGIFEAAHGGTVYLDELHFLDLKTQAKLLRTIREKTVRRTGALKEEKVDFNLVVSSWPDIEDRVTDGTFLPDLYYRLRYLVVEIPPLRDRLEDIEPLVAHFCEKHFQETGVRKDFLMRTIRKMEKHIWPGNVGDLDGCVSASIMESTRSTIDEEDLRIRFPDSDDGTPQKVSYAEFKT